MVAASLVADFLFLFFVCRLLIVRISLDLLDTDTITISDPTRLNVEILIRAPRRLSLIGSSPFSLFFLSQLRLAPRATDRFSVRRTDRATARPYHVYQKAATASRRQLVRGRPCLAGSPPPSSSRRFTDRESAATTKSSRRQLVHQACSLVLSLSLSFSAGKVDLSDGRFYYLLFALSTSERFQSGKAVHVGIFSRRCRRRDVHPLISGALWRFRGFYSIFLLALFIPDACTL